MMVCLDDAYSDFNFVNVVILLEFVFARLAKTPSAAISILFESFIFTGDLFITNSWLPHSFTRNQSEQPFEFIHFNIYCEFKPQCKPPIIV